MDSLKAKSFLDIFERSGLASEVRFAPGATVFRQGARGDAVYAVRSGRLGIFRTRGTGREMIASRAPGHLVGEMALFGQRQRSASLVALEESALLRIDGERMLELMGREPELSVSISRLLATRLQELMDLNLEEKNRQLETGRIALEATHRELQAVLERAAQGIVCL